MRVSTIQILVGLLGLVAAAPTPQPSGTDAGNSGVGAVTGPIVESVVGGDNVQAADNAADTLGVAQYNDPDNSEDQGALPQELLNDVIGKRADGILTSVLPEDLAEPLEQTNTAVDSLAGDSDQVANNILGVCGENTTPSDADCNGISNK